MELRNILKEESSDYYNRIKFIEKEAEGILPDVRLVFPKYTNHDIAHTKGIEQLLNEMIPNSIKENLKPAEIFYLLVATLFHDVGMKLIGEEEEKKFNSLDEDGRGKLRDKIRDQHHIRSSNYIKKNASDLNLKEEEAAAIADISRAHRKIDIQNELREPIHNNDRIHLKFLGALLRVADECHVTDDRVSELFFKTINSTSWEFEQHFKKHRLIKGILFNENEDNKIRIHATVKSENDEDILGGLKNDIEKELNTVKRIFEENKLRLDSVVLELDRDELIKKNIISKLLDGKKRKLDKIILEIEESQWEVKRNLDELKANRTIQIDESGLYNLTEDISNFEELIKRFTGDKRNWKFVKSNYSQKMVETNLIAHLQYNYNIIYIGNELRERVEILKNSPTAIYLSLKGKKLLNNPYLDLSLVQGDVILDQILLLGLSYDIFKYPITNNLEIKEIVESLTKNSGQRIPELSNLYEEVQKNSKKDDSELFNELINEKNDNEERKYSFNIKFNFPELSEEPTFLAMLSAAMKTGTRIVVTGSRISDFILKEENEPVHMDKVTAIEISPGTPIPYILKVKNTDFKLENLEFRFWKINEIIKYSTESRNLPFKFEFSYDEKDKTQSVHFEIDPNTNVKQLLKWEEFLRALNQERTITLIKSENNQIFNELKVPTQKEIHVRNDSSYEYLKKLVKVQERTNHEIKLLKGLNVNDKADIDNIIKIINDGKVEVNSNEIIKPSATVKEIKKMIKAKAENEPIFFKSLDFKVLLLEEEINLGPVTLRMDDIELIDENGTELNIEEYNDEDILPIKICTKDEKVTILLDKYSSESPIS
ncbi:MULTISPECIES: HD domain-containing protein [Methanobacterium]|uniref:HD-CE domain-containing protein n=1 Tax=Methanobacterium bryantii TaxID=2161 RepID=A0A2A2H3L8_METBR|nr:MULTISPECIES: hypothetical protein [Methanobacterium]OEC86743.1 hypothetical protein A9507_09855 [Methanobacterium sp. A39]PAV04021.1 hypothetical protein ASJ80_03130 [Methanobacterium bryantii]